MDIDTRLLDEWQRSGRYRDAAVATHAVSYPGRPVSRTYAVTLRDEWGRSARASGPTGGEAIARVLEHWRKTFGVRDDFIDVNSARHSSQGPRL